MRTERRTRFGNWLVPYDDAKQEVVIERSLMDILKAVPGDAEQCMNSRCIRAQRNRHAFPHPVLLVSTIASRVFIVDRLDENGEPAHVIRYELSKRDSKLIHAHDAMGAGEAGPLKLRVPKDPKGSPKRAAYGGRFSDAPGRYSGDGKAKHMKRPVTSRSIGAKHRIVIAVGGLGDDGTNDTPDAPEEQPEK
jgi:hypothetical protein